MSGSKAAEDATINPSASAQPIATSESAITKNNSNSSMMNETDPKIAMIVPRGCKIRDEFVCPITRELITDPVIAADGHTYDRSAIEQWLHGTLARGADPNRRTSPKTGQPLEHLHLIPNHNLKRLLSDMIKEGGEALYSQEEGNNYNNLDNNTLAFSRPSSAESLAKHSDAAVTSSKSKESEALVELHKDENTSNIPHSSNTQPVFTGPRIALVHSKVLHCRCLGPPESDWNNRSFRFAESSTDTLLGGRRRPHEQHSQNFCQFTDATVSRRHFEIRHSEGLFQLRDLGSAGGTFVRIPPRKRIELREGTMVMLGKHQLMAMEVAGNKKAEKDEIVQDARDSCLEQTPNAPSIVAHVDLGTNTPGAALLSENDEEKVDKSSLEQEEDDCELNFELIEDFGNNDDDLTGAAPMDIDEDSSKVTVETSVQSMAEDDDVYGNEKMLPLNKNANSDTLDISLSPPPPPSIDDINTIEQLTLQHNNDTPTLITLRCFAPEGTPIQNRKFPITAKGATLGRKQSNTISFSHPLGPKQPEGGINTYVGIDSSISGEHATIQYNKETKLFELFDGVNNRGSTNGTWVRLSPMHEESDWYSLDDKSEILIGTVRFQVAIDGVVVERDIYDDK